MKRYRYKAVDINKRIIKGIYKCNNLQEAIKQLKVKNLFILNCEEMKEHRLRFRKKLSTKDTYLMCQQFYQLLKSGISLTEVIQLSSLQSKDEFIREVLWKLLKGVSKGERLYSAMENSQGVYSPFMISMVKIGEESGNLEEIFYSLNKHYYNANELKNKIRKSMTYPLITLTVSIAAMFLLRIKAMPAFINMLLDMGGSVPLSTKIFIFLFDKGIVFINVVILITLICFKINNKYTERIKFKFPIISNYILRWEEIKFIKSLSILLNSGVNVIRAFETIIESTSSVLMKEKYHKALERLKKGSSLWKALEHVDMFQSFTISMISISEISGNLDRGLINIERILSNEFNNRLNKVAQIIEPVLIIIISIFVGFIIISTLIPIINITSSISL